MLSPQLSSPSYSSQVNLAEPTLVWSAFIGNGMEKMLVNISSSTGFLNDSTVTEEQLQQHTDIDLSFAIPVGIIIGIMVLATVVGNAFVVVAVVRERQLHSSANRVVASLAVTDTLVAVLVMPLSASALLTGRWPFGNVMCDIYTTLDVLCCTSSILHLVAIAIDRYWTVTDITYTRGNNAKTKYFFPVMVTLSWLLSATICLPPFFGWKQPQKAGKCEISQKKGYTIYSTGAAFWIPLFFIIAIYTKIFLVVRSRVRKKNFRTTSTAMNQKPLVAHKEAEDGSSLDQTHTPVSAMSPTSNVTATTELQKDLEESDESTEAVSSIESNPKCSESTNSSPTKSKSQSIQDLLRRVIHKQKRQASFQTLSRKKIAQKKERRAIRTLLIITGIFITCWLPFFILATMTPFCGSICSENIPKEVYDFFNWLGYCNSMLNPIIYTIFSPDFRIAFRKILSGHYNCLKGHR